LQTKDELLVRGSRIKYPASEPRASDTVRTALHQGIGSNAELF